MSPRAVPEQTLKGSLLGGSNVGALFGRGEGAESADVRCAEIRPDLFQPRQGLDTRGEDFQALVRSIEADGVLQPLIVRRAKRGYDLIAGHRRLAAAQRAGLVEVPVRIHELSDLEAMAIAITENIARADLTPWEEARSVAQLADRHDADGAPLPVRQLARLIGRSTGHATESRTIGRTLLPEVEAGDLDSGALNALPRTALIALARADSPGERQRLLKVAMRSKTPGTAILAAERKQPDESKNPLPAFTIASRSPTRLRVEVRDLNRISAGDARQILEALEPLVEALRGRLSAAGAADDNGS